MRMRLSLTLCALAAAGLLICAGPDGRRAAAGNGARLNVVTTNDDDDMRERDEVNETYRLAPGAEVQVESISGSVKVETAETETAEVHILRLARTRDELVCRPVQIEHTDSSLHIDGQDNRRQCRNARVAQQVTLRLPRRVNLNVSSVSGHVEAGDIDGSAGFNSISGHATVGNVRGPVSFNSISGHVQVGSALDAATLNSISGHVTITLTRLGAHGLRAHSISGSVDVGLGADVNADLHVESISGGVYADDTRITINKVSDNEFTGRVGAGGPPLEFFSISGNIHLHRAGA
jgi:DUF4097 and DUF4098 domain-containing protein YvlB